MSDIRKVDPAARRRTALVLVVGAGIGALAISAFTHYRFALIAWVHADPGSAAQRLMLVFLLTAALGLAPLFAFAAYLWRLGGKVVLAQAFPPPGMRVVRDTPILTGERAVSRGRLLKVLALGCGVTTAGLAIALWRFAVLLGSHAA